MPFKNFREDEDDKFPGVTAMGRRSEWRPLHGDDEYPDPTQPLAAAEVNDRATRKKKKQEAAAAKEQEEAFEKQQMEQAKLGQHLQRLQAVLQQCWGDAIEPKRGPISVNYLIKLMDLGSLQATPENGEFKVKTKGNRWVTFGHLPPENEEEAQKPVEFIRGTNRGFKKEDADAVIALAALHGWKSVNVHGNERQQKLLYIAAMGQGLDVTGYTPDGPTKALGDAARARFENEHPELAQMDANTPGVSSSGKIETTALRNNNQSTIIDPASPASMALLGRAYDGVYTECFPLEDEREEKADLLKYAKDGDVTVTLVGENLGTAQEVIKGLSVIYNYPDNPDDPEGTYDYPDGGKRKQFIGLLGYLGVSEPYRKDGIGRLLFDASRAETARQAAEEGLPLTAMIHECNPVGTEDPVMDPATRIGVYERWGCIALPIPYSQQPLTADGSSVPLTLLVEPDPRARPDPKTGVYPISAYPSKQAIKDYLFMMADEACENAGQGPADKNKLYLDMVAALDKFDLNKFYAETIAQREASLGPKFNASATDPHALDPHPPVPAETAPLPGARKVTGTDGSTREHPSSGPAASSLLVAPQQRRTKVNPVLKG